MREAKIPLHIIAANVNRKKKRIFSSAADPDFPVAKAVRASMSIPLLFAPVEIDGDKHVDGGMVKNFPVDVFTNGLPTIGLRVQPPGGLFAKIKNLFDYIFALLDLMIDGNEEESIDDADNESVVTICTKYNTLNFNIAEPDVDVMIQEGYRAAASWLDKHQHLLLEQKDDLSTEQA
jgi:NTE family protein